MLQSRAMDHETKGDAMPATLYLVRHGRTMFNEKRVIQGWCDSPLTHEGEEQAARVGRYFAHEGVSFDHAYASTLARTHQTIEAITDMSYGREPGLREWFFGAYEGERVDLMPTRPWGDYFVQFGGEGEREFHARICSTLREIMARPGHENVLVVSHGSACREFMLEWREGQDLGYPDVPGSCSVMRYTFDGERFELVRVVEQDEMRAVLGE